MPKIIKIELGLTKLLQKIKRCSFFDSHGIKDGNSDPLKLEAVRHSAVPVVLRFNYEFMQHHIKSQHNRATCS